ncbi:MAG: bifunctional 5,10-methylenetetrahydrofolate dehydrogenase/5,10-methenyltetrahydrofolate cyclohydrolase [Pyrinomonadaceae bacterium]
MLDGALVAEEIKREVSEGVNRLRREHNIKPCLAVVRIGEDPASIVYVRNKVRTSEALGLRSELHALPAETTTEQLLALVNHLNERDDVDGLLVQLPLPPAIKAPLILQQVAAAKDVDGLHPLNAGRLALGEPCLAPCTPAGIIELLERSHIKMSGARAVIVGRVISSENRWPNCFAARRDRHRLPFSHR